MTNRDITTFHFSCVHECKEWKWKSCSHCRSRKRCCNHVKMVSLGKEGINYLTHTIEVSPQHAQDLGTLIHEISENTIITILCSWRKDWYAAVKFKGYNATYISHFITLWGTNNNRCLEPVTRKNRPKW